MKAPWRSGSVLSIVLVSALAGGCTGTEHPEVGRTTPPSSPQATRSPIPSPIAITPPSAAFPDLNGKYKVGRRSYQFVDETREEPMTREAGDKHSLTITVYYPAGDIYNVQHAAYLDPLLTETVKRTVGARSAQFLSTLVTHAYKDAPPATGEGGPFPVLLFWPGTLNTAAIYSTILENLASHGYVAVGITEPYNASYAELDNSPDPKGPGRVYSWAADEPFILMKLSELNNTDLGGVVDVDAVAVGGHSAGGDAAGLATVEHGNVKAMLNLDGAGGLGHNPSVPSLLMSSGYDRDRYTYDFRMTGIAHSDFETDVGLLAEKYPSRIGVRRGSVRPARMLELVVTYSLAFLDKHLKSVQTSLLDGNSTQFPEMQHRPPA